MLLLRAVFTLCIPFVRRIDADLGHADHYLVRHELVKSGYRSWLAGPCDYLAFANHSPKSETHTTLSYNVGCTATAVESSCPM